MVTLPSFSKLGNVRLGVDAAPQKKNKKNVSTHAEFSFQKKIKKKEMKEKKIPKKNGRRPKEVSSFCQIIKIEKTKKKETSLVFFFRVL